MDRDLNFFGRVQNWFVASVPVPTCFEMTNVFIDFLKDWTLFDFSHLSPKEVASEPLFVLADWGYRLCPGMNFYDFLPWRHAKHLGFHGFQGESNQVLLSFDPVAPKLVGLTQLFPFFPLPERGPSNT